MSLYCYHYTKLTFFITVTIEIYSIGLFAISSVWSRVFQECNIHFYQRHLVDLVSLFICISWARTYYIQNKHTFINWLVEWFWLKCRFSCFFLDLRIYHSYFYVLFILDVHCSYSAKKNCCTNTFTTSVMLFLAKEVVSTVCKWVLYFSNFYC